MTGVGKWARGMGAFHRPDLDRDANMDSIQLLGSDPGTVLSSSSGRNTEVAPVVSGGAPGQPNAPITEAIPPGDRVDLTGAPPAPSSGQGGLTILPDGTYQLSNSLSLSARIQATHEEFSLSTLSFTDTRTGTRLSALDLSALRQRTSIAVQLDFTAGILSQTRSILPQSLTHTINSQATQLLGKDGRLLMDYLSLIKHLSRDGDTQALEDYIAKVQEFLNQGDVSGLADFNAQVQQATGAPTGAQQSFELQVNVEVTSERTVVHISRVQVQEQPQPGSDPLILDLNGNGAELAQASYDLTGDGVVEETATAAGGDAFLALDRSGNGQIDGGQELFGDQHGAADGFAELARYDANGDQLIDARDPIFANLLLFRDANRDGKSQTNELSRLSEAGIAALSLESYGLNQALGANRLIAGSTFLRNDGSTGQVYDAVFATTA